MVFYTYKRQTNYNTCIHVSPNKLHAGVLAQDLQQV
ncbi:hypothetical protein [Pontibacter rugosus]|uniref:Uncharacterized protein n=1 Tax=Pontibacter rugosus TaxID=1745966 RepID=A0ABW3SW81_9BACT